MKRLMLILPVAVALLSGCAVYDPGLAYPVGYYAPPPRPVYVYPAYAPPPVYGSVWFGSGRSGGYRGGHRGWGHWR